MPKSRKIEGRGPAKCKTPPLSRPWMARFLELALKSADVEAACAADGVKIGLGEYLYARRCDPGFNLACVELDLICRAAAVACLEAAAARGEINGGKLRLLIHGIDRLRVYAGDGPGEDAGESVALGSLPHWIAADIRLWRSWRREHPGYDPGRYSPHLFCRNQAFRSIIEAHQLTALAALAALRRLQECQKCTGVVDHRCRKCGSDHRGRPSPLRPSQAMELATARAEADAMAERYGTAEPPKPPDQLPEGVEPPEGEQDLWVRDINRRGKVFYRRRPEREYDDAG
jgi:hypothetical protein